MDPLVLKKLPLGIEKWMRAWTKWQFRDSDACPNTPVALASTAVGWGSALFQLWNQIQISIQRSHTVMEVYQKGWTNGADQNHPACGWEKVGNGCKDDNKWVSGLLLHRRI